jgi:hypothetical protein
MASVIQTVIQQEISVAIMNTLTILRAACFTSKSVILIVA